MQTTNLRLILKHKDGMKWEPGGEQSLPVLPRIGEYVALPRAGADTMYQVVGVIHAVPFKGFTEVFAVYAGTLWEIQDKMLSA
jgi:hypothetical protein